MLDYEDIDARDAAWLASPLISPGDGVTGPRLVGILWHPSGLTDRDATPQRVLHLFEYVMAGRRIPRWVWLRPAGSTSHSHQFATRFGGIDQAPRCGLAEDGNRVLADVDEWEHQDRFRCPRCVRIESGEDEEVD